MASLLLIVVTAGLLTTSTLAPLPPALRFWAPLAAAVVVSVAYSRRLRGTLNAGLFLAIPLAVSWAAVVGTGSVWRHRLEAFKAELRGRGIAASLTEVGARAPAGESADPGLVAAFAAHDTGVHRKLHPGSLPAVWTEKVYREETAFVQGAEGPLLAKAAPLLARRPVLYSRVDWAGAARRPFNVPMPKFANLVAAGNVLGLSAGWRAYRGETALAWDRVRTLLDLADLVSTEYTLIGKMIAVALRRTAARASCSVLLAPKTGLMPGDIAKRLSSPAATVWVVDGLKGEMASDLDAIAYLTGMRWEEFSAIGGIMGGLFTTACLPEPGSEDYCGKWAVDRLKLPMEYLFMRFLQASGVLELNGLESARYMALIAAPLKVGELPAQAVRVSVLSSGWTPWPHFWAMIAMPKFADLQTKGWEAVGWDRLAATVSALKAYRRAHGRFPARLDDLGPGGGLEDPFTEKPFKYMSEGGRTFQLCGTPRVGDRPETACVKSI